MKNILMSFCFVFIFCTQAFSAEDQPRALFVSVIQDPPVLSSRDAIDKLIIFAKQSRINILFVQVYHSGQAWFPSKIADDSHYKECLQAVKADPLTILIRQAHAEGIQVHAWLNVMSLGSNAKAAFLQKYGTKILTRNLKDKNKIEDFKIDGQYFLEPGDPRVRRDLSKMLKELLNTYPDLDGVQFDYIRYPDPTPHYGYTPVDIARFKKFSRLKAIDDDSTIWKDWKRRQVTETLTELIKTVHAKNPHIQVSTTGCMPYARAYYEAYQDWPKWLSGGLIDFVTIMDYSTDLKQFEKWIGVIKEKTGGLSKVKIAVGAYKTVATPEIFEKEFASCESMGAQCVPFHYGSILKSPEMEKFLTSKTVSNFQK